MNLNASSLDAKASACRIDLNLEQLLQDPLIRLVMASDGVIESDIRGLAQRASHRRATALAATAH